MKTYRINGKTISSQPHLSSSLTKEQLLIGQSFFLLFSTPLVSVHTRLAVGRQALLDFFLADGTPVRARVRITSSTYSNSSLLVLFTLTKGATFL